MPILEISARSSMSIKGPARSAMVDNHQVGVDPITISVSVDVASAISHTDSKHTSTHILRVDIFMILHVDIYIHIYDSECSHSHT